MFMQFVTNPVVRELTGPLLLLLLFGMLIVVGIRRYLRGDGLRLYLSETADFGPLFVRKPTDSQRKWLMTNIVAMAVLFEMFAIPVYNIIASFR